MADTTFYNRGDAYHDSAGNPAIIKRGNELTFTEHFNAGGGGTPYTPPAYSTEEVATGANWIDGKPVYRKVIVLSSKVWIGTSITTISSDVGIDTVINAGAIYNDGTGKRYNPIHIVVNNGDIYGKCEAGEFEGDTFIIEYTKTAQALTNTRTVKKSVKKG